MFSKFVNVPCINALFTGCTICTVAESMHPVTMRLYEAVRLLTRSDDMPPPSRVVSEANISFQTLNNWHERGPSAQGLLDFQLAHGVNATWLLTGHGPQLIGTTRTLKVADRVGDFNVWPLSTELVNVLSRLEADERRKVENSIRGQLDMPPLAATTRAPRKAAGGGSANS